MSTASPAEAAATVQVATTEAWLRRVLEDPPEPGAGADWPPPVGRNGRSHGTAAG